MRIEKEKYQLEWGVGSLIVCQNLAQVKFFYLIGEDQGTEFVIDVHTLKISPFEYGDYTVIYIDQEPLKVIKIYQEDKIRIVLQE